MRLMDGTETEPTFLSHFIDEVRSQASRGPAKSKSNTPQASQKTNTDIQRDGADHDRKLSLQSKGLAGDTDCEQHSGQASFRILWMKSRIHSAAVIPNDEARPKNLNRGF